MQEAEKRLKEFGYLVKLPPREIVDPSGNRMSVKDNYEIRKATQQNDSWIWAAKREVMREHFDNVMWADVIVVLNYDKDGIANYIGANTLLEMGLAFHHRKKIYLLNPIPEMSYKEEVLAMHPTVLRGDLLLIQKA
ncbi:MAG: hypothetical protein A3D92_16850 [Bacteroidetes bacterium RIFCSPHIGHO2_02_FULL_44_7]|nr:MAG: hypothetical protein A3D92_16850 [Bacteroidetes bacterium RIFCSPHIGHO2_02_FULL_44_7]